MLILLAGYAAAWSLYGAIAKGSQDLHFDIGEMFAWSHQVSLSAPTHPPLGAWLARAWFAVMPRQDWAFYLFGISSRRQRCGSRGGLPAGICRRKSACSDWRC